MGSSKGPLEEMTFELLNLDPLSPPYLAIKVHSPSLISSWPLALTSFPEVSESHDPLPHPPDSSAR